MATEVKTQTAKVVTPAAATGAPKPRVLICDDSRIVRASISQHLRDRFELREVTDGEAAWQAILLDSSVRVVISDLTMPKVDGFELLNRVRSSKVQRIRELPMVIISGEDEAGERERAASLGATDFIQKGVGAAELLARMEVLVRLSTTREMLAESQASLESSRTVDSDTELLNQPFFDKQVEKLISFARRNLSD
ncbi:MAG TPA: response regulator, partial [Burkholderiaceae bacterium]|nr:response regulator [Burkholderiaceae bacterium]